MNGLSAAEQVAMRNNGIHPRLSNLFPGYDMDVNPYQRLLPHEYQRMRRVETLDELRSRLRRLEVRIADAKAMHAPSLASTP